MRMLYIWLLAGLIAAIAAIVITVNVLSHTPPNNGNAVMPTAGQLKADTVKDNKLNAEAWSDNENGKPPPAPNPFPQQPQTNK